MAICVIAVVGWPRAIAAADTDTRSRRRRGFRPLDRARAGSGRPRGDDRRLPEGVSEPVRPRPWLESHDGAAGARGFRRFTGNNIPWKSSRRRCNALRRGGQRWDSPCGVVGPMVDARLPGDYPGERVVLGNALLKFGRREDVDVQRVQDTEQAATHCPSPRRRRLDAIPDHEYVEVAALARRPDGVGSEYTHHERRETARDRLGDPRDIVFA
jgi:hypothetical protein